MKYCYMPGCSLHSTSREYDLSGRAVCRKLGIDLVELDDWNCCGADAVSPKNRMLMYALNARNLAIAEKMGLDIVTFCASCFYNLKKANFDLRENPELRDKTNKALEKIGMTYKGKVEVKHLLEVLVNDFGLEKIKKRLAIPLKGLKVITYYGCLLTKHPETRIDDPENPEIMDVILEEIGAEVLPFSNYKTDCCGGPALPFRDDITLKLSADILKAAKKVGPNLIVTACPLCQISLETRQKAVEREYGFQTNIPVVYFTQLVGLALGIPADELGMKMHLISPIPIVTEIFSKK